MIEHLGLIYTFGKNLKDYFSWKEDKKLVDWEWLEKSGFKKKTEEKGYKIRWTLQEKIETRKLDGYEIIYEIDKKKRVQRYLEMASGNNSLILMGVREHKSS